MTIWAQLTFFDLVIAVFLAVIVVAFGFLIYRSDTPERAFQKIIGGFAVFIVALISKHPYVIAVSLFIGGLIIASEHFMKSLAAILRADSPDIPSILFGKASAEDVKKKEEEEVKTIDIVQPITRPRENDDFRARIEQGRRIENMVAEDLDRKFPGNFFRDVKLFESGLIVDGVITDRQKKNPARFVEIKYLPKTSINLVDFSLRSTVGRIRGIEPNAEVTLALVTDNMDFEQAGKMETEISKKYKKVDLLAYKFDASKNSVEEVPFF